MGGQATPGGAGGVNPFQAISGQGLGGILARLTDANRFATNPANGGRPTVGDAFQGIGHSMMNHFRGTHGEAGLPVINGDIPLQADGTPAGPGMLTALAGLGNLGGPRAEPPDGPTPVPDPVVATPNPGGYRGPAPLAPAQGWGMGGFVGPHRFRRSPFIER